MNYPARKFNPGKLLDRKNSQLLRRAELPFPGDPTMYGTNKCTFLMPGRRNAVCGVFKPLS
jgi:hypothetical protein